MKDPETDVWFQDVVLYILGIIHLFFSSWMLLEYFVRNYPHFRSPPFPFGGWMKKILKCLKLIKIYSKLEAFFKKESAQTIPESPFLDVNIFGMTTVYLVLFFACSFLSLFFHGYFYCICLLYVIVNNEILLRVLRAVTMNGQLNFVHSR